jgi:hypothetical protein
MWRSLHLGVSVRLSGNHGLLTVAGDAVLTHGTKEAAAEQITTTAQQQLKRPQRRPGGPVGRTIKMESPHGTVYTTVNENGSKKRRDFRQR